MNQLNLRQFKCFEGIDDDRLSNIRDSTEILRYEIGAPISIKKNFKSNPVGRQW